VGVTRRNRCLVPSSGHGVYVSGANIVDDAGRPHARSIPRLLGNRIRNQCVHDHDGTACHFNLYCAGDHPVATVDRRAPQRRYTCLIAVGLLGAGANLLFGIVSRLGRLALVAVLGSLNPGVTAVLAWLI
jgi:hypothetical protein